jgi:hypothetical protein
MVVNPFELTADEELTFTIYTDENTITKTITGKNINFAMKNVITLNLAIDNTCDIEAAAPVSNILPNGTYVIADNTSKSLMIPGNQNNYRGYASYTTLPTKTSAEQAWILTSIGTPGANLYTIQSAESNKYLAFSGSSNYAYLNDDFDETKATMLIEATSGGYLVKHNNTKRMLSYNTGSPRFAFYSNDGQNEILTLAPVTVATTISVTSASAITVNPAPADGTINYTIIGADAEVTATSSESWLTIADITKTSVAYSISENASTEARNATITLSYGDADDVVITVTQNGESLTLTTSENTNIAAASSTTLSVGYNLNATDNEAVVEATSSEDWLEIGTITKTSVPYSVLENTTTEARTATITLTYGELEETVTVTQSGAGSLTEYTVTYTVANKTSVTKSGTAPTGSSATFNKTYTGSIHQQMTGGNSTTLTLSGYDGAKITGITLSMKSNSSKGAGSLTMTVGSTPIAKINDSKFNTSNWAGKWSTSYIPITPKVTATTVGSGEKVTIVISASANSLYIEKYTITYEK